MVTCCCKGVLYIFEDALTIMLYTAGFAMHQSLCLCDFAAVCAYYSLMPKADAQRGHLRADLLEDRAANAEVSFVVGVTRTRRDDYSVWFELLDLS